VTDYPPRSSIPHPGIGFAEFVGLMTALLMVNAMAIDIMLPALESMGVSLHIATDNQRQWIISAYLLGMGMTQLVYGTLADRYGRKPVLLWGLGIYTVFGVVAAFANSFETMIAARAMQGVGSAAARVLMVAIVRDCYSGRRMASVISLAISLFLAVPILAPSLGQLILLVTPWRSIFVILVMMGAGVTVWVWLRLPETLHPQDRLPISPRRITSAFRLALTTRVSVGYMLAATLTIGASFGFLNSAQQVFVDVFHVPRLFTLIFALSAGSLAASSMLNARLVGRIGMRVLSHRALVGYIVFAFTHLTLALTGHHTVVSFAIVQSGMMFCIGMVTSNFSAMAMEPLGHIAGTASSVQGFVTTFGGALIGFFVGQHFDGTIVPLTMGFSALGTAALLIVLVTEKGRLFQPTAQASA
jgi:DHA1 family bicyclomycin/chloramphenicol resistance-like MFS transporter